MTLKSRFTSCASLFASTMPGLTKPWFLSGLIVVGLRSVMFGLDSTARLKTAIALMGQEALALCPQLLFAQAYWSVSVPIFRFCWTQTA